MIGERIGLAVWLKSNKHVRSLRRFGNIIYVSKQMKYVIIYCDKNQIEDTIQKISDLPFVTLVQPSSKPFLKTEYEKVRDNKEKEYDLKIGL